MAKEIHSKNHNMKYISLFLFIALIFVWVISEVHNQAPLVIASNKNQELGINNQENLEKLKIKETKPLKYAFESLDDDVIEIGTEKHSPPKPYLKLEKWDGEVSLRVDIPFIVEEKPISMGNKIRYLGVDRKPPTYSQSWGQSLLTEDIQPKIAIDFYPKEPEEIKETINGQEYTFIQNEQGGVEFDIVLYEKPESNQIAFPLETQGLKFYYQPPLHPDHPTWSDEDGDGVADNFRPENIVGSYAVYHETQNKLFKTKEEVEKYKVGKAFHIYRPKIIDSAGNWVWGELNVDEQAGTLTVTTPQDFIDEAVYPIRIDPNFGYETAGTSLNTWKDDELAGYSFTSPADAGVANSLSSYGFTYPSERYVKGIIVLHSSLTIINDGITSPALIPTSANWVTTSFATTPSLSPNTEYVLMIIHQSNSYFYFYYDSGDAAQVYDASNSYDSPTDPTDAHQSRTGNKKYSIYCTYSPSSTNYPPVANDDAYNVDKGATLDVVAPGVLDNDSDADGNPLTAIKVSDPIHGSLTLNADGSFTYTHDGSESASDNFTYQANDGFEDSNIATVNITINPLNYPPVATDDAYSVDEGATLDVLAPGVLDNDSDADGNPLTAIKVSDPIHGSLTLNADGSFSYTHDGSESASDNFTYQANDGFEDSNIATVNISINPLNYPPVANDDAYSVDKGATLDVVAPGVLDNDSDADGNPLTAIKVSDPTHGSLTLNADGSFSYTHDGSESASDNFTYQANDGFEDSNIATVNITTNGEAIIIDHNCTEITQIPEWAIVLAKNNLHIGYGHTSHGSQITDGMMGLVDFANSGGKELSLPEDIFAWNNGGTDGALDLEEGSGYSAGWLAGDCGSYGQWEIETREYLDDPSHSDVNVIIWSWCGQVDNKYASGTLDREYLTPMTQLEADYPDVTFVYMTGHVDHWDDANNKAANQMIRDFCIANGKVLYDFADIESYDPDGTCFEFPDDNCNYYNSADNTTSLGNWAMEWQDSHTQDVDWYNCSAAHTEPLNANQKAYAAWWLWARLGGWDATSTNQPPVLTTIGDKYVNEGQLLEFTVSATDPDEDDLTYSVSNLPPGANFTSSTGNFSWTPTEDQSGIYPNICFVVSDGTLTDSECISITVHDVHYVSISGNDNNTGTLSQPWRTITYAASQVQPGDTVYVRGGTYNEQVIIDSDGNADNWITFINYLGETPIIDGSFLDLSLDGLVRIGDANYIVFDGFYVTNSDNFGVYIFQCDHIIVQNSTTNNSGLFCIGVNESSEVWLTNITNDG